MGTYTYYQLKSSEGIENIPNDTSVHHVEMLFKYRAAEAKWYEHREDLQKVAKANPNTLIIVECHSEDDEFWKLWFVNDKMFESKGVIVYEEPDLNILYE